MKTFNDLKRYFKNDILFENDIDNFNSDIQIDLFFSNTKDFEYLSDYFNKLNLSLNKGLVFSYCSYNNPLVLYKTEILKLNPIAIIIDRDIYFSILYKDKDYLDKLITELTLNNIKLIVVKDLNIVDFLKFFYSLDLSNLNIYGVTGTNGKTTITTILYHLCRDLSNYNDLFLSSLIGTIKYCVDDQVVSKSDVSNSLLTTPDTSLIYYLLFLSNINKVKNVFMEVSSHSLDQDRPKGLDFKISSFTNLGIDHLDYHKTIDNYFEAKKKLFFNYRNDFVVINRFYNEYGNILYNQLTNMRSMDDIFSYFIKYYEFRLDGMDFVLNFYKGNELIEINFCKDIGFSTNLIGVFNIHNLAIVFLNFYIMCNFVYGVDYMDFFRDYIKGINFLEGRLELVSKSPLVFVDYAHTPDALENVIKSIIEYRDRLNLGDIYVVFGAGGNRDKTKRPIMGNIVSNLADKVIITSDNPRDEDPLSIINDILSGVVKKDKVVVEVSRESAIIKALNNMKLNDILLIAGKGHENYQIIGNKRVFFSDKEVVKKFLSKIRAI